MPRIDLTPDVDEPLRRDIDFCDLLYHPRVGLGR
jgi:hypothetical protein